MIHPTAIIDPSVELGSSVSIGPYTVIGPKVKIEDNCIIHSHCAIGGPPEFSDRRANKDYHEVIISHDTEIREFVTINGGFKESTYIGPECYIMGHSHIAHDCILRIGVTISHGAIVCGHVNVLNFATLGVGVNVHQRSTIGAYAMIGANATVVKDVYPLSKYIPSKPVGINYHAIKKHELDLRDYFSWNKEIEKLTWNDLWKHELFDQLVSDFDFVRDKDRNVYSEGIW